MGSIMFSQDRIGWEALDVASAASGTYDSSLGAHGAG